MVKERAKKSPAVSGRAFSNQKLCLYQAKRTRGPDWVLRRNEKPTPAIPSIIIIHVAGSGTAAVTDISSRPKSLPEAALTSVKMDKLVDVLVATKLPVNGVHVPVEPNTPDVAIVCGVPLLPIEMISGETFGPP